MPFTQAFLIENDSSLQECCEATAEAGWITLDTEFMRERTYYPQLCLEIEKGHQRANWAQRPLPQAQLEYALDDVRHLADAYPLLLEELDKLGRLDWVIEDSRKLLNRDLYVTDPAQAYLRIGQLRALPATEQHVLRELASWREQLAQETDKPRGWIGSDNTLVYLAQTRPDSVTRLQKVRGLGPQLVEEQASTILDAIARGNENTADKLMSHPQPLTEAEQKLYKKMKKLLDERATELGIDPPALGTRKDIEQIVRGNTDSPLLHGWRREVIGQELADMR